MSDLYLIQKATLDEIAQAIQNKNGTTDSILLTDMKNQIESIETGGGESVSEKWLNRSFTEYSDNSLTKINDYTFAGMSLLSSVNLPVCSDIGAYAFGNCNSLTSVNLPMCTRLNISAFTSCSSLTSIDLPMCKIVGAYAFINCASLTSISLPTCNRIETYGVARCSSLTSIDLPMCSILDGYTFANCSSLTSIGLPVCGSTGAYTFSQCSSLTSVNLPVCSFIGNATFSRCTSLTSLTLGYSSVAKLSNVNAFNSTPMSISTLTGSFGSIYVPASLVDAYKSATNWTTYADRITTLEEIKDISDIIILSNTTKTCEIQLTGFNAIPENATITINDDSKLNISNIQTTINNITFDVTAYDTDCEIIATVSLSDDYNTYTKSFNIIVVSSPIGEVDISPLNIDETRTILIPWYGYEPATNLSIVSSDTNKLSIANIQSNIDNISFDIASPNETEGEANVTITATHINKTYIKTNKIIIDNFATYTVEELDTNYTFVLNDNGYYESNNKGKDNTFAMCKVNIRVPEDCTMYVDCINYAESTFDFGILSNLNKELAFNNSEDIDSLIVKHSFKGQQISTVQTIEYSVPTGNHFIYVKYKKDQSNSTSNDSLQFKIRFE